MICWFFRKIFRNKYLNVNPKQENIQSVFELFMERSSCCWLLFLRISKSILKRLPSALKGKAFYVFPRHGITQKGIIHCLLVSRRKHFFLRVLLLIQLGDSFWEFFSTYNWGFFLRCRIWIEFDVYSPWRMSSQML